MVDITTLPPDELKALRRDMQIIFQDPFSSLNLRDRLRLVVSRW
ncbi:MAG: hypothetical protein R2911_34705 [Caldilineaceae bacterium]